eukprot:g2838.t1
MAKDLGLGGEWLMDRSTGFDDFLSNVMEFGWIKRSVAGLMEGYKSGSVTYHIEQNDGDYFIIEDKTKGRKNEFRANNERFFYVSGFQSGNSKAPNASAAIEGSKLVCHCEFDVGTDKTVKLVITRYVNEKDEYVQEISGKGSSGKTSVFTRIFKRIQPNDVK